MFATPSQSRNVWLSLSLVAIAFGLTGCPTTPSKPGGGTANNGATNPVAMRVLVVDDELLAKAITDQWSARSTGETIDVKQIKSAELSKAKRLGADVIVLPSMWLGDLAERELVQPLPEALISPTAPDDDDSERLNLKDWFYTPRHCDASWGRKVYGIPLGSPQFVLMYRKDVFEKLKLEVPTTWAEYQAVVEKLRDPKSLGELEPDDGVTWSATLEPLAAEWAGHTLLARAAAYSRGEGQMFALFDTEHMQCRLATPSIVRAAEQLAAAMSKSEGLANPMTPDQVRAAFLKGHSAMAITWPTAADGVATKFPIGFAELPGADELYNLQDKAWKKKSADGTYRVSYCAASGRIAAVTKEARRSSAAFQFLAWLNEPEVVRVVGPASTSTTLFAASQLATPQLWVNEGIKDAAAQEYAKVVEVACGRTLWMPAPRIPGQAEYLSSIDAAVAKIVNEKATAEEALQQAATKWNAITEKLDITKQRRAYQRSVGNDF